jgi:hypothetical protein
MKNPLFFLNIHGIPLKNSFSLSQKTVGEIFSIGKM